MKNVLLSLLLFSIKTNAQPPTPDYSTTFIESSRSWIDVDFVGDGITGHKLDVLLPKNGKAPYPVIICIYGSAWFANNLKGATFTTGLGQGLLKEGFAVVSVNYRSNK